jgi:hypothetical protein
MVKLECPLVEIMAKVLLEETNGPKDYNGRCYDYRIIQNLPS